MTLAYDCLCLCPHLSSATYPKPGDLGMKARLSEDECEKEVGEERTKTLENRGWTLTRWLLLH